MRARAYWTVGLERGEIREEVLPEPGPEQALVQTLQEHLEAARQQVEAMGDPRAEESARQKGARQRAARERKERLEKAVEELAKIRQSKSDVQEKESARVSLSDPTSRIMKEGSGGGTLEPPASASVAHLKK